MGIFQAVWQAEQDVIAAESALDADDSEVARTNLHHARAVLRHKLSIEEQFWQQELNGFRMGTGILSISTLLWRSVEQKLSFIESSNPRAYG